MKVEILSHYSLDFDRSHLNKCAGDEVSTDYESTASSGTELSPRTRTGIASYACQIGLPDCDSSAEQLLLESKSYEIPSNFTHTEGHKQWHVPATRECRWHGSASSVGNLSSDGHVFTKFPVAAKPSLSRQGEALNLAPICMVYDHMLRCGGIHEYNYQLLDGQLGKADGVGFVFDSKLRRNNIQRMRSVFLNQRGQICVRNLGSVTKLHAHLPAFVPGMSLSLQVDLDNLFLQFVVFDVAGMAIGMESVSLQGIFVGSEKVVQSGFFCAVVTQEVSVSLF